MKRIAAVILIVIMVTGLACSAAAAPSISQIVPENPEVISGDLKGEAILVIQNANPDAYENKKVAEIVAWAKDENTVCTVDEILTELGVDTNQEIKTESGETVNPTLYEQMTPFVDLVLKEGDQIKYKMEGEIKASIVIEAAKGMDPDEVLLMQIDPVTGEVYFIVPESVDPETGKIVATFPTLGPITLLKPVDIVSKNVSPENYESKETAEVVDAFKNEKSDIELADVVDKIEEVKGLPGEEETDTAAFRLNRNMIPSVVKAADSKASGTEELKSLTIDGKLPITDTVSVPVKEYSSAMGFADLAIKYGKNQYLYNMKGSFKADVHRDIGQVDWKRIVLAAYPDFDIEEAEKDMSHLTDLDPFTLEDSFIMQLDPITGDVEYFYEPVVYFAYSDTATKMPLKENDNDLYKWLVDDEDRVEELPNLVINAEYKNMGPFVIFMPKTETEQETAATAKAFPIWWIILFLILLIVAVCWFIYRKKRQEGKKH